MGKSFSRKMRGWGERPAPDKQKRITEFNRKFNTSRLRTMLKRENPQNLLRRGMPGTPIQPGISITPKTPKPKVWFIPEDAL